MNARACQSDTEWFEAFHGAPAAPWGSGGLGPPSGIFTSPVVLDLKRPDDLARFPEFGLSLEHVKALAGDDPTLEQALRRQLLDGRAPVEAPESELDESTVAAIMRSEARRLPYVETVASSGHFLTVCPASGRPLKSDASFVVDDHHVAYRFTGNVVFYLMVGRYHGRRAALCVPSHNVIVTLDVPERGPAISRWVAQAMHRLIRQSLALPDKFAARLNPNPDELHLVVGGMGNLGHHIWQEMSGIEQLLASGRLPRIRSLLVGPHTWFRLEQVFPEIAGLPIIHCATPEDMMLNSLNLSGTVLRPIGMRITKSLRARLKRAASVAVGPKEMRRIAEAGNRSRLIWINLRAHNKMWNSQIEGYAAVLNALQLEYRDVGVVYDGWKDTADIRDEIDRRLNSGITRHDIVSASIESCLAWADVVTTFISVVGSGLVLNSWLVEKPGVAHANRGHLRQCNFWNSVSQGMVPTTFISPAEVSCDATLYGNYDFDWHILLPPLREALAADHRQEATMAVTNVRIDSNLIEQEISKRLSGKSGRRVVLVDQDFKTTHQEVEIIDIRTTAIAEFSNPAPSHVLYAVDQDDLGLPFVMWLIERRIKFYPVWQAQPAGWIHKDIHARHAIESEYAFQHAAGFDKFDFGYGDFENICQALATTQMVDGAYVEVGCFRGSSGGIALKYMQEAGIYRPTYFLDVFDGFTYDAATLSPDAIWTGSHKTEGPEVVARRLKRFEQPTLGRSVNVIKNNIVADALPSEIGTIAVANLDVDQLEAVYCGLIKLAPKIAIGGILIVEDPGHTPLLIGAQAALAIFLRTAISRNFRPIYMGSGQFFLIRIQ